MLVDAEACEPWLVFLPGFGTGQLGLTLGLRLFVLSWQEICHSKSHTQCHGPWPGSLMRQVSEQC